MSRDYPATYEEHIANQQEAFVFDHNPDVNPDWVPLGGRRVVRCVKCGTEQTVFTNHTGTVWALRCVGWCRTVISPNTAREVVLPYYGPHSYVGEA